MELTVYTGRHIKPAYSRVRRAAKRLLIVDQHIAITKVQLPAISYKESRGPITTGPLRWSGHFGETYGYSKNIATRSVEMLGLIVDHFCAEHSHCAYMANER